nr:MAG TPA: hypothetical protein [Caudoviricetes sp.]
MLYIIHLVPLIADKAFCASSPDSTPRAPNY